MVGKPTIILHRRFYFFLLIAISFLEPQVKPVVFINTKKHIVPNKGTMCVNNRGTTLITDNGLLEDFNDSNRLSLLDKSSFGQKLRDVIHYLFYIELTPTPTRLISDK